MNFRAMFFKAVLKINRESPVLYKLHNVLLAIVLSLYLPLAHALSTTNELQTPPNIIVIFADDLGVGDVGVYGQTKIQTPHLDRLANEGMMFNTFYSAAPVCAPSRDAIMTGRHSGHLDRRDNQAKAFRKEFPKGKALIPMPDETITIAERLKENGYATAGFGKWGLGNPGTSGVPWKQGFDLWYGYIDQVHAHHYFPDYLMKNDQRIELPGNKDGKREQYTADMIHQQSLDFIRENKDQPFFAYIATTLPHTDLEIDTLGAYEQKDWPIEEKTYAAMVSRMDDHVGELMALLKTLNIDENTIVFFTSDNGPSVRSIVPFFNSNGGLKGIKRSLYEGGIREPMIVRWPDHVPAGVQSDYVWWTPDVLPTVLEIVGLDTHAGIDGRSVLPTLLGQEQEQRDYFYFEFFSPFQQAVRQGDWKAYRTSVKDPVELYNLKEDAGEQHNVAKEYPEIAAKLTAILNDPNTRTDNKYWPVK